MSILTVLPAEGESISGEGLSGTVRWLWNQSQGRLWGEEAVLLGSVGFDRGMFEKDILGLGTSKVRLKLGKEGVEMERLGPECGWGCRRGEWTLWGAVKTF